MARPTRELPRLPIQHLLEPQRIGGLLNAPVDLGLRQLSQVQREREVLAHAHVRVERIVLKDHGNVTVFGRHVVHESVADVQVSCRDRLESSDHAQCRALPAPRRSDQHDELSVADIEIDAVNRDVTTVLIYFAHAVQADVGHGRARTS
jgi:hypothetical protein